MKTCSAILFLLVFGVSSQSGWILDSINHYSMRAKVEAYHDSDEDAEEVSILQFNKQDFSKLEFEDEGKEVSYNGEMYDIISVTESEGKVVIHCFADKKETRYKLWAKNHRTHKKSRVKQVLPKLYSTTRSGDMSPMPGTLAAVTYLRAENNSLPSPLLDILKPPPDHNC